MWIGKRTHTVKMVFTCVPSQMVKLISTPTSERTYTANRETKTGRQTIKEQRKAFYPKKEEL